jgi:t-SNARE complex subunit (syntaxin)
MTQEHEYTPVRTGDYDEVDDHSTSGGTDEEEGRVELLEGKVLRQNKLLEILENSVSRIGQLSLHISNEIDAQNHVVNRMELESEDMEIASQDLTSQSQRVQRNVQQQHYCFWVWWAIICVILTIIIIIMKINGYHIFRSH